MSLLHRAEVGEPADAPPPRATGGPARRVGRRPLRSRLSRGHLVVVAAVAAAVVANLLALRAATDTVVVLTLGRDVASGQAVTLDALRPVDLAASDDVVASLVGPDDVAAGLLDDRVAVAALPAGAPLRKADLRAVEADGLRRMSLPLRPELAVGGAIRVDDRVDVIAVDDGSAHYLVGGARVLAVADGSAGGLAGPGAWHVTLGVDAPTALCLAAALDRGDLSVVLSTGQRPAAATGCAAAASS